MWLAWILWFVYCVGVIPTWSFVYVSLRPGRPRFQAWAIASALATVWFLYLPLFVRWARRHELGWVDELERELHAIGRQKP